MTTARPVASLLGWVPSGPLGCFVWAPWKFFPVSLPARPSSSTSSSSSSSSPHRPPHHAPFSI
eukprot:7528424-Pyramimonas_sp.AAC.1